VRILFVEDDYMTIDAVVTHLRIEGHEVDLVRTPADAIEKLMWETYQVVFLDVMFAPGEIFDLEETAGGRYTGLSLLEVIHSDERIAERGIPLLVLVTNWRDEPQVEASAERFGVRILRKPLSLKDIEEAIGNGG